MSHIKTYADMCEEKKRLQALLEIQRKRVTDDWQGVKDELEPVRNVFGVVGKMARSDKSNPLLNMGLKVASDLLIKNFVLSKAGWATRLAVPFVVKNYSSHLFAEKGKNFISKIGRLFNRRKNDYPVNPDETVIN